jgi:hypothetical protein
MDASTHLLKAATALLVGFALDRATAIQLLREWDQEGNPRPWALKEIERKCDEALRTCTKSLGYLLTEPPMSTTSANGTAHTQPASPTLWAQPRPPNDDMLLPAFPVQLLPPWLAEWVSALATATQTPADLAAMLSLAIAGAALAKKFRVRIRDDWTEPTNLLVVVTLPPGERKSAVFAEATKPIRAYESAIRQELAPVIAQAESDRRVLAKACDEAEKRAARQTDPEQRCQLQEIARQLAEKLSRHHVPPLPQLWCEDETPQSLEKLVAFHDGRMLQACAEGTPFANATGRYGDAPNVDIYLKGHAGDALRTGRIGRPGHEADLPAVSAALAVQPDVIQGLGEHALLRHRGFLARWLYALPRSLVGKRTIAPPPVPAQVSQRYHTNMLLLWRTSPAQDPQGNPAPYFLHFDPDAQAALRAFEEALEPQLAEGENLAPLAGWGNKLPGTIARLAAILHVTHAIGQDDKPDSGIPAATVSQAIEVGRDYLLPHAQAAFRLLGTDEKFHIACRVVKWLTNRRNSAQFAQDQLPFLIRQRDILTGIGGHTSTSETLTASLDLLVTLDCLRPVPLPASEGPGRRPSTTYEVNPGLLDAVKRL